MPGGRGRAGGEDEGEGQRANSHAVQPGAAAEGSASQTAEPDLGHGEMHCESTSLLEFPGMRRRASIVLGLAFSCLLGVDASAAPTTRGPTAPARPTDAPSSRPRPKVALEKVQRPVTRKQLRATKHKQASGVLADLLVRIADGKTETKMEKKVAKRLGKSPARREAMQRLATRWKSASENDRRKAIGRVELGKKPEKGTLESSVADASSTLSWLLRETIPLPPQNIPKPAKFQLVLSGVQTIAAHDADGSDELSTLTILATPNGNDYALELVNEPHDGTIAAAGASTTSVGKTLYDGADKGMLVITALIEDEGGNSAASRAEIETMVELATAVASTLDGADRLAVLEAMIDYTFGLDALDGGSTAASRSVACVQMHPTDWYALWGIDPETYGGVKAKLAVPHTIGSGKYELMLNVPSVLPPMRTVLVSIDKFWLESHPPLDDYWRPYRMTLNTVVGVGDPHLITLDTDVLTKTSVATYERKVVAGEIPLRFAGTLRYVREFPKDPPGSEDLFAFCRQQQFEAPECYSYTQAVLLDLAKGGPSTTAFTTTYDTDSDELAGGKRRSKPNKATSKGEYMHVGGITITVTDIAPPPA